MTHEHCAHGSTKNTFLLYTLHEDDIKWKHFRPAGPLWGESTGDRWIPLTKASDVFFDLCLNNMLSKQWRRPWFEAPSCSLWRHCNVILKCKQWWLPLCLGLNQLTILPNINIGSAKQPLRWMSIYIPLLFVNMITYPLPYPDAGFDNFEIC